jgi:hypothetical protein
MEVSETTFGHAAARWSRCTPTRRYNDGFGAMDFLLALPTIDLPHRASGAAVTAERHVLRLRVSSRADSIGRGRTWGCGDGSNRWSFDSLRARAGAA